MSDREPFKKRLKHSLDSDDIPVALRRGLGTLLERRNQRFAPGEFAGVQQRLSALKEGALARLPELVDQFTREAEAVGTRVHLAETVADAQRIIGEIARAHEAQLIVKSKSMATEEIEINGYLEKMGVEVVETDLGEWIIQLAHEHPSHLIAPAIHMTRERVAELFNRTGKEALPAETQALVKYARRKLREKFIAADIGITGANIGIASTGTIAIVTNEGNADMVSTLPPVHIAVLGIEKIVPTLDEATEILKVLARNATGQKFSTYVNMITGPSRTGDIEMELAIGVHGPLEQHIVLLDNGRWRAREDPDLHEALRCIRCGACANVCPPYSVVGGQAFGYIYTGPIGLVLTALHHGLDHAGEPDGLCASCNACEQICPVAIPIPRQIIDVRQRYVAKHGLPVKKKLAISAMTGGTAQKLGRLTQAPFTKNGYITSLPLLGDQSSWRQLPAFKKPLSERALLNRPVEKMIAGARVSGVRVAYFSACITENLSPESGIAAVRVLRALGCSLTMPRGWSCCGLVASNAGDAAGARRLLKETIAALEEDDARYIVSTSTSCVAMLLQDAPHLLRDEPGWRTRAETVAARVVDFARFVSEIALPSDSPPLPPAPAAGADEEAAEAGAVTADGPARLRVTYHDPCQSANCLALGPEARHLLRDVCGLEVSEMAESSVCCGFGGAFSLEHPEVAKQILARKLANVLATGAGTVVMDNPGCLMHIKGGLRAAGRPEQAKHLAEVMAERLLDE